MSDYDEEEYFEEGYDEGYEDGYRSGRRSVKKQSDGCYVATCVYGSYDCPEVWTLRRFRDQWLKASAPGRAFVRLYYAVSPGLVRRFGGQRWFCAPLRRALDSLVHQLNRRGYEAAPYEDRRKP